MDNSTMDRARSCIGARFRLHGRDPATGLDCAGLAAFAAGIKSIPSGYALRGGDVAEITALIDGTGLERCSGNSPGTIQLVRAGPAQFHLIVRTENGFVHADAGLRRVVERPGLSPWPVIAGWRVEGE